MLHVLDDCYMSSNSSVSHPVVDDAPGVGHQLVVHLGISMVASPGCSNGVHFDRSPLHSVGNVHCCQIGHGSSKAVACSHDILCARTAYTDGDMQAVTQTAHELNRHTGRHAG